MRTALVVAGAALVGLGGVWLLQGIGVLKGSGMTGQNLWAWVGAACIVGGLVAIAVGRRIRGSG